MKIDYLLQLKKEPEGKNPNIDLRVRNALKTSFFNVTTKSFLVLEENAESQIKYRFLEHKVEIKGTTALLIYLTFFIEDVDNKQSVGLIDQADLRFIDNINKGESKFHVTRLYDERSIFYCIKAYPYFCRLESKLRCLILKLLTKTFGYLWAEETIPKEIKDTLIQKIRSSSVEKLASDAIYEMDYSVLKSFLFTPYRTVSSESIVDVLLSDGSYQSRSKDEIFDILKSGALSSNWDRFFGDVHIENLDEKITDISKQRNKIAHSKFYCGTECNIDTDIIKDIINQVDTAIQAIDVKEIKAEDAAATLGSFLSLNYPGLKTISETFIEVLMQNLPDMKQVNRNFSKILTTIAENNLPDMEQVSKNFSKILTTIVENNLIETDRKLASEVMETIPKTQEPELQQEQFVDERSTSIELGQMEEANNLSLKDSQNSKN